MAVAVVVKARDATSKKRVIAELTFSGTYTTGGEAPTGGFLKVLGLSTVDLVLVSGETNAIGVVAYYDYTNHKIQLWEAGDNAELDNGDAIAFVVRAEFVGDSR